MALVVALDAHPPTAGQTIGAIVGTGLAVGLAEIYSELVGAEARRRHALSHGEMRSIAAAAGPVVFGACFPAVFFVLAAAGAMELDTAFTLSIWTGLGLICAYGFAAGRLAGSSLGAALLHAGAVGAIGGALILLKSLLH